MALQLSQTTVDRLESLAAERGCSVDVLMSQLLDKEQPASVPPSHTSERFIAMIPALVAITDHEMKLSYVNDAFCATMGYEREELITLNYIDFVHPGDIEIIQRTWEGLHTDGQIDQLWCRCRCKDGSYKWLSWLGVVDGERIYLTAYDVTVHKKLEKRLELQTHRLEENRRRLRGILNSQIDFVCRYLPDTTLTFVNDAYCNFFNKPPEDLIGQSFLAMSHVEDYPEIMARLEELERDPSPAVRIFKNLMTDERETWIQWVDFGILDEDGRLAEIQAVGRDVTDLILAERELKVQNEVLQTIFDRIPIMLVLFDKGGRAILANKHWIDVLGWTAEEMNQHPDIMAAFYPDEAYRAAALEYMQRGEPGWRDFEVVSKDGSIIDSTWANVRLSDGRSIGIGQDIRLRKMYEEQKLYAAQLEVEIAKEQEIVELRDRLITTVSHEFRTPLTIILSSAEIMSRYWEKITYDKAMVKLNGIMHQVNHMVAMLDDVLKISRFQSGNQIIHLSQFDPAVFLTGVVDKMRLVDQGRHHIVLHVGDDLEDIKGDKQLLENVFTNLLSNAIKYSPPDTEVRVEVNADDYWWYFSISDEGIGIPEEDQPYLFKPFFRGQNVRDYIGTGLGLSIVRQYVEMHEGQIKVQSIEKAGTTFSIKLPKHLQTDSVGS